MPQFTATSTAQQVAAGSGAGDLLIQNLGPNPFYLDVNATVTASGSTGGIKIEVGGIYSSKQNTNDDNPYIICATSQTTTVAWVKV